VTTSPKPDGLDVFNEVQEVAQPRPVLMGSAALVGLVLFSTAAVVGLVTLLLRVVGPWLVQLIGELTRNMLLI
jgi:hypothetical protein